MLGFKWCASALIVFLGYYALGQGLTKKGHYTRRTYKFAS
jgi:hypothetical protein